MTVRNTDRWKSSRRKTDQREDNASAWVALTEIILDDRGLLELVAGTATTPPTPMPIEPAEAQDQWKAMDEAAKLQISWNMEPRLLKQLEKPTAARMMRNIKSRFLQFSEVHQALYKEQLLNKKNNLGETLKHYFGILYKRKAKFENTGGTLSKMQWRNIVSGLLQGKWAVYAPALLVFDTAESIIACLGLEEERLIGRKRSVQATETELRTTQTRLRIEDKPRCPNCKRLVHNAKNCWRPGGGNSANAPKWFRTTRNNKRN